MNAMDDKKKLIIIGALAAVLLAVGAFQFVGKGSPEQAPAPAVAAAETPSTEAKPDGKAAEKVDPKKEAEKNTLVAGSFAQRDPFKPILLPNQGQPTVYTPNVPQPAPLSGALPVMPIAGPGAGIAPVAVKPEFAYKLSGVIVGARPAAVFTDEQGDQRLVTLGSSLDPDTKLIDIDRGGVKLQFRGKTLTLNLGGDSSDH